MNANWFPCDEPRRFPDLGSSAARRPGSTPGFRKLFPLRGNSFPVHYSHGLACFSEAWRGNVRGHGIDLVAALRGQKNQGQSRAT